MLISKLSPISMKDHTREIPVTQEQIDAWKGGVLIPVSYTHLTLPTNREV